MFRLKPGNSRRKGKLMKDDKKTMITKTAQEFLKLNEENKMFILGYMFRIQQERQEAEHRQSQLVQQ
jgi:hypothetical protein